MIVGFGKRPHVYFSSALISTLILLLASTGAFAQSALPSGRVLVGDDGLDPVLSNKTIVAISENAYAVYSGDALPEEAGTHLADVSVVLPTEANSKEGAVVKTAASSVAYWWMPDEGVLLVSDHNTGLEGEIRFDFLSGLWVWDTNASTIYSYSREYIELGAAVVATAIDDKMGSERLSKDAGGLIDTFGGSRVTCSGSWVQAETFSNRRSWCCMNVADEVNEMCSNGYCYGCCATLACDAACVNGDYFCMCSMYGKRCASVGGGIGDN